MWGEGGRGGRGRERETHLQGHRAVEQARGREKEHMLADLAAGVLWGGRGEGREVGGGCGLWKGLGLCGEGISLVPHIPAQSYQCADGWRAGGACAGAQRELARLQRDVASVGTLRGKVKRSVDECVELVNNFETLSKNYEVRAQRVQEGEREGRRAEEGGGKMRLRRGW